MKIMLVGGGSGGHLTPLLAVAEALKKKDKSTVIVYLGQKQEGLSEVLAIPAIDRSLAISAGKFRRYHGDSLLAHLTDFKTIALNIRDFFRFALGTLQAWRILGREKPNAVFLKGGFVCVPVGLAARLRGVPYITHDSDAIPGLANRITAKHASMNTTALEPKRYPYDKTKTIQVGIPLQDEYQFVTLDKQRQAKKELGYTENIFLIASVGGGLGARRVNKAVVKSATKILKNDRVHIVHMTGKKLYNETLQDYSSLLSESERERVKCIDFTTELFKISAAADIVILRAGATNLAEMAAQGKACIVIPNPALTGGQQLHNADVLIEANAAYIVPEDAVDSLADAITQLMNKSELRASYSAAIHSLAYPGAADTIAELLLQLTSGNSEIRV